MSETAKWYVIHTYSGYENKVRDTIQKVVENRGLQELIPEVRVPTEKAYEKRENNKIHEYDRKIFPGYVLVKMILTDDSWYVVRNVRGVTGFVGPASKPVPLTDAEVAKLAAFENEEKPVKIDIYVGDKVKVNSGNYDGLIGTVQEIHLETNEVTIMVPMFGRDTETIVSLSQISKSE